MALIAYPAAMIRLRDVCKSWDGGATFSVDHVSLHVPEGALLALVGESGSGKTTTLKLINRLVEPTSGRIEVGGEDVTGVDPVGLRRRMGFVLQAIALFPHWTVARNVSTVPRLLGWEAARIRARVDELLDLVGLPPETYRDRLPAQLSGGQRQRVGVARALAAEPPILLMDEPFGALDPVTRDALQQDVRRLHGELGLTTVLVTHDMAEALTLADRVAVMREGRLVGEGAPGELLHAPPDPYIEALLQTPLRHAEALTGLRERP
jgi:osmoprotectant transport system ATP-binding protein